ncbi:histidine--tRNA ligase [Anaerococcus sp.]|uniref:histidine--tRNA ligase n=1 Tax=Anaerococcus sp. TaxID=1872515 RepID=UPI0029027907|nr:histidine--tRNA ligase [Anaerococcus sp.]MDU2598414.1 histidine--tRNA ligase [Anaerococcus sp.]MDU4026045.1 histidine--tRNA ligase [Anaerococcus sp.]
MNIVKPSTIAGVMELLPEEQAVFDRMKNTIEETFKDYNFLAIDTPVIEKNEILFAKGGGETEKQIFEIASESKDMSLRFDLTVPLARYVSEHFSELNFPFKRYQIGKVYRGERNQKGRYKEFYQADIDIIGNNELSIYNDAILARVIFEAFNRIDFPNITFHINNRKLLNGFFESLEIEDSTEVLRTIDKKDKIGIEKTKALLDEIIGTKSAKRTLEFIDLDKNNSEILNDLEKLSDNELFLEGLDELKTVYEYMLKFGIDDKNINIDLSITRGLDYYTSTVYETFIDGYEAIGSVCSGGRYENLASNFSKQKLPGVGMSIGLTRLFYQLIELGLIEDKKQSQTNYLILPMEEKLNFYAIDVLNKLKAQDKKADIYLEKGKFKKKINYADKINAEYVVIIGEEEASKNEVSIKNMQTGEQVNKSIENLD